MSSTTKIMALALGTLLNLAAGCGNQEDDFEAYFPHAIGDTRIYDQGTTSGPTTSTSQGTQVVTAAGDGFFQLERTTDPGSARTTTHLVIDDAGISIDEQMFVSVTPPIVSHYAPAFLFLQRDLSIGSTVSMTSTITQGSLTFHVQLSSTVSGEADVTVPAGTFSTLQVTTVTVTSFEGSPATSTSTTQAFWAKGVGPVKTTSSTEGSDLRASSELVSYSLK